jgi:hypothetical protein
MELKPYFAVQRAKIAHAELRQQDARSLDDGPTMVLAHASGSPRLWGYLIDTVLDGFGDGFMRPHDGRISTRLHQGLRVAQQALRTRVDGLLEKRSLDVGLLALSVEGSVLHVLVAGSQQAYLVRHKAPRRLCLGNEPERLADSLPGEGMLKLEPTWCAEQLEPGDVLFATDGALCTPALLRDIAHALELDRTLSTESVVALLNRPSAEAGRPVASLALRVPSF